MPDLTLVLLCAGNSTRFKYKIKKQWIRVEKDPLWLFVTKRLENFTKFANIIIVANKKDINYMKNFTDHTIIEGGNERQISLKNALSYVNTKYVLVTDVARACIEKDVVKRLIEKKIEADIVVPYIKVSDTVHYKDSYLDREHIKLIQTPQLSKTSKLKEALQSDIIFTDDSSAIMHIGGKISYIEGSTSAVKLTRFEDLQKLPCLKPPIKDIFCGSGFDVHSFEEGSGIVLGGVDIKVPYGLKAHSDGDVVLHALIDALLGAIGGGDIGELFPDNDPKYKNADSKKLLSEVYSFLRRVGYEIVNIDITIMAQKPKISPYKTAIKEKIANILDMQKNLINIKATTTEHLGFIGRKEGIAVHAIAQVKFVDPFDETEEFDN